jgi:hypothetical protein
MVVRMATSPPRLLEAMRGAIAAPVSVVDVPDLRGVVIGPAMIAVAGDVTFDDALTVPEVEAALFSMETELTSHWADVRYVHLTPFAAHRPDEENTTEAAKSSSRGLSPGPRLAVSPDEE